MMNIKFFRGGAARLASTAAMVLIGVGVFAQPAMAQIKDTKHNLGSGTGAIASRNQFSGTQEICVFCHTPHGSDTSAVVPLWNRKMAEPNTYQTYNSLGTSSLDGATAPVGSVSLACLSCHDGAQAMNTVINQPGSGSGTKASPTTMAGNWGTGSANPRGIALLGQDLRNDHPVGIQYAGGPVTGYTIPTDGTAYDKTKYRDKDFEEVKTTLLNDMPVWWVNTTATGSTTGREKTDMLLYTRSNEASVTYVAGVRTENAGALTAAQPYVECASCHDPHTTNTTFLRIENTGSAVCLACHIK